MAHARFLNMIFFTAALAVWGTATAQTLPSANPQNVQGNLRELTVFTDGTAALLTQRAIYIADDKSLTKWTARAPLPVDYLISSIIGGSAERIYVVRPVNHDPSIRNVSAWTSEKGFQSLRDIPMEGACSFADAKKGVVALDQSLDVTLDGGTTWHKQNGIFPKGEHLDRAVWTSSDHLLLWGREGTLERFHMEKNGRLTKLWATKIAGDFVVEGKDQIWAVTPLGVEIRSMKDGAIMTPAKGMKISISDAILRAVGDVAYVATMQNIDKGTEGHIDVLKLENKKFSAIGMKPKVSAISMVVVGDSVFGMFKDTEKGGQPFLARLTPDAKAPEALTITADNGAITNAAEQATPAGLATPKEIQEMSALARQIPPIEQERLAKPIMAQQGLTNGDRVRLVTAAFKRFLAEKGVQNPSK